MELLGKKTKEDILEEKAEFTDHIHEVWMHENYEKIKEAHNEISGYLRDKGFDFFSVQYLLTMTYMELLIAEYMSSHKSEITARIKAIVEGIAKESNVSKE